MSNINLPEFLGVLVMVIGGIGGCALALFFVGKLATRYAENIGKQLARARGYNDRLTELCEANRTAGAQVHCGPVYRDDANTYIAMATVMPAPGTMQFQIDVRGDTDAGVRASRNELIKLLEQK